MNPNIGRKLNRVSHQIKMQVKHLLKDKDIGYSESRILLFLNENPNVSQDDVTNYLCINKGGIARLIKKLEKKDLIIRSKDLIDLRMNRINLSSKGKNEITFIRNKMDDVSLMLIKDLNQEEVIQLDYLLDRLDLNLKGGNKSE